MSEISAIWAAGDYDAVAEHIWDVGAGLVGRLGISPGDDVLDVACGTGNAAVPAAAAGARVIGVDLTSELFDAARRRAQAAGVEVSWVEGDAQALPFPDGRFDVVMSTFGVMFAPEHERSAAEMVRVLRPEGRIGLCSWTPEGNVGEFFRVVGAHAPPTDGPPPVLWGTEEHVRQLFPGLDLAVERAVTTLPFPSVEAAVDFYATNFGPVVALRARLEPAGRWPALRDDLGALFARTMTPTADGVEMAAEYLVAVGR